MPFFLPFLALAGTATSGAIGYQQARGQKAAAKVYASAAERDAALTAGYQADIRRSVMLGASAGVVAALLFSVFAD